MTQAVVAVRNIVARSGFANPLTLGILVSDPDYVKVYADEELLVDGVDYEITGIGDPNGIEIEIIGAEDPDNYVGYLSFTALFEPPLDQQADLSSGGVLGRAFENGLDQQNRRMQSLASRVDRSIKVPPNIDGDMVLGQPVDGAVPVWDDDTGTLIWRTISEAAVLDPTASSIAVTPAGTITALNVQDALEQLDDLKLARAGGLMTGPIRFSHLATPSSPAAGQLAVYAKNDDRLYTLNSAGVEIGLGSGDLVEVTSIAALKALDTTKDTVAYLRAGGRSGVFVWTTGNFTSLVAADTLNGVYAKADAISAGTGAWVRVHDDLLNIEWFGAIADNATDCQPAIQAVIDLNIGAIYVPPRDYKCASAIELKNGNNVVGFGPTPASGVDYLNYPGASRLIFSGTGTACVKSKTPGSLLLHGSVTNVAFITDTGAQYDNVAELPGLLGWTFNGAEFVNTWSGGGGVLSEQIGAQPNWINRMIDCAITLDASSTSYCLDVDWTDSQIETCEFGRGAGVILRGNGNVGMIGCQTDVCNPGLTLRKETTGHGEFQIIGTRFDAGTGDADVVIDGSASPGGTIYAPQFVGCSFRSSAVTAAVKFIDHASDVLAGAIFDGCLFSEAGVAPFTVNTARWTLTLGVNYYASGFKPTVGVVYGNTGAIDNRLLRSDGTGEARLQNSAIAVDDSGNMSGVGTLGVGAITSTGILLINVTGNVAQLTSIDNGAVGPGFAVRHDSASPAAFDIIGLWQMQARNSAATMKSYADFRCIIDDPTSGSEDAHTQFTHQLAGTQVTSFNMYPGGLQFPATQIAWADANTLDDYEEGSFTPTIIGTGTAGTGTYTTQDGNYTKIGERVSGEIELVWTAHTGTTNMKVGALPFTNGNRKSPVSLSFSNLTFAAALHGYVEASATTIALLTAATGAAEAALPIDTAATLRVKFDYAVN